MLTFSGERIVPEADNCEPRFALKMYQEHIARYLFASQAAADKHVLDVGCGVGYGSQLLAKSGAKHVTAFDLSLEAIQHAREFYPHRNLSSLVGSAEEFGFAHQFDLITAFEIIEHLPRQHKALNRIAAALKPNGLLVISTPRPLGQQRSAFHERELSFLDFSNLLTCHFPYIEWFFENNHFASLVAGARPASIESVHTLHPQFDLGQADYFVAVASHSPIDRTLFREQLVLNNDDYVRNLERDVNILHEAENDYRQRIKSLEGEGQALRTQVSRLQGEAEAARQDGEGALRDEIARLQSELTEARQREAEADIRARDALHRLEQSTVSAQGLQHDLDEKLQQEARNAAEISRLKEEINEGEIKLKRTRSQSRQESEKFIADLMRFRSELTQVREDQSRAQAARASSEQELALARQQLQALRQIASGSQEWVKEISHSRSWRVTQPLRHLALRARGTELVSPEARAASATVAAAQAQLSVLMPSSPELAPRNGNAPSKAIQAEPKNLRFDVLYVVGCNEGESKRYRVHNLVEGLTELGYSARAISTNEIPDLLEAHFAARVAVLFRCDYGDQVEHLLRYCKNNRISTVFDIDDLVFEPDSIGYVRVVNTFTPEDRAAYLRGVQSYRKALLACDRATCTTNYLARRIAALGKKVDVIPNSLNEKQLAIAREIPGKDGRQLAEVRIGYFSGSNTHQVDFEACESALLTAMENRPELRFVLVGILDLDARWNRFSHRIEKHPLLPYDQMLKLLSSIDINLAPLEMDNPYCESKSQLKIFEAGLVGVPTVASEVESYGEAIDNGVDGFLASNSGQWLAALEKLIDSKELRTAVGERAKQRASSQFGPKAVAQRAESVYGFFTDDGKVGELSRQEKPRLRIAWIIPGLIIGSGGHRNILRAAYHLQQFGHQLELYFTNTKMDSNQLAEQVRAHFYPLRCPMHRYDGQIEPTDVLFATHWTTVDAAVRARSSARELMYFVQDFEPAFAPMGTEYILAENTYRLGLYCITSGPWCETLLRTQFQCEADHFVFPIDRAIYHPRARTKPETNVIFFARPEMPRRCFELGVLALEELHRLRPDVEIILFGSPKVESHHLPFPATKKLLLPTIDDLATLYANADLGIAFSTTNPSLVPYEMMACGLPVVDLGRPGNEVNYGNQRDIALLAPPDPKAMAARMRDLLEDSKELFARSNRAVEFVQTFPSEEEMARRVEELILKRMAKSEKAMAARR